MQPDATLISRVLERAGLRDALVEDVPALGVVVRVEPIDTRAALCALKDSDHAFTVLVDLFGVDSGEGVDVVYHLRSISRDEDVIVKVAHPYGATLGSVWTVFLAASFPERECAEMFGLTLEGNPNPKHLLLTDGVAPLLLKCVDIRPAEEVRNR